MKADTRRPGVFERGDGTPQSSVFCITWADFLPVDVFGLGITVLVFLTLQHATGLYGANRDYDELAQRLRNERRHVPKGAI